MANKLYNESDIQAIANAIRTKAGTQETMTVSQMATAISNIPSGTTPSTIQFEHSTYDFDIEESTLTIYATITPTPSTTPTTAWFGVTDNSISIGNITYNAQQGKYAIEISNDAGAVGDSAGVVAHIDNMIGDGCTITFVEPAEEYTVQFYNNAVDLYGIGAGVVEYLTATPGTYTESIFDDIVITTSNENVSAEISSYDEGSNVIEVDVTGWELGTTIVTATAPNGATDTMTVTVYEEEPSEYELYFDPDNYSINLDFDNSVDLTLSTNGTIDLETEFSNLSVTLDDDTSAQITNVVVDDVDSSIAYITVEVQDETDVQVTAEVSGYDVSAVAYVNSYYEEEPEE